MSSGKHFFIQGLNKIISSQHVVIRTDQTHFMQQNSMGDFGPGISEYPAQCYCTEM